MRNPADRQVGGAQLQRHFSKQTYRTAPALDQDRLVDGECKCHHDAAWLKQEIAARRWVQEYRVGENGEYVLVCVICGGLWDHRATDRLIDLICGPNAGAQP
jgi:hypothetical protein